MSRSTRPQAQRTLAFAGRFLEEFREDAARAALRGEDIAPRLRSVHEHPGHTTPEFRTIAIPIPPGCGALSPDVLSGAAERYAALKHPDVLLLAFEAEMDGRSVVIAEARDREGTRRFLVQPYTVADTRVVWDETSWADPGEQEMLLDAAFEPAPAGV